MAGSNPDEGDIFSERYLARKGCEAKGGTRMMDNEMQQNWKGRNDLYSLNPVNLQQKVANITSFD